MGLLKQIVLGIFLKDLTTDSVSILVQKRVEIGPLNGLWEFPGGKIEPNESPESAVRREITEETGLKYEGPVILSEIFSFKYPDRDLLFYPFLLDGARCPGLVTKAQVWYELPLDNDFNGFLSKTPEANRAMIINLCNFLKKEVSCVGLESFFNLAPANIF